MEKANEEPIEVPAPEIIEKTAKTFNLDSVHLSDKRIYTSTSEVKFSGTESEVQKSLDSLDKKNESEKSQYNSWKNHFNNSQ